MIWHTLIHSITTLVDLLALMTCIGVLGCRLGVLPTTIRTTDSLCSRTILEGLWRLLAVTIALVFFSGAVLLIIRSKEMTGFSVMAIFPVLPAVVLKTHFGNVWLVRVIATLFLGSLWCIGRRRLDSVAISVIMLCAGAVIALTRSASGHAANESDLVLPELMDWLHLVAASFWGGGLIVLSGLLLPMTVKAEANQPSLAPIIARRFSSIAGLSLATIVVTAAYNAWLQVGSFHALWRTPYGQTLMLKLLLSVALVVIGASNRYISIPLFQKWEGHFPVRQGSIYNLPFINYFFPSFGKSGVQIVRRFMKNVRLEVALIIGVLVCTALLVNQIPARHFTHIEHKQGMEKSNME